MSRCMAFPPPGYVWNGVEGEALRQLLGLRGVKREMKEEKSKGKKEKGKHRENKTARKDSDEHYSNREDFLCFQNAQFHKDPEAPPCKEVDVQHKFESDQYSNLIVDWMPPPMQMHQTAYDDDQHWFLSEKSETSHHLPATNHFSGDIYALPFTVPF